MSMLTNLSGFTKYEHVTNKIYYPNEHTENKVFWFIYLAMFDDT